jgi:hypothetical protein
MKHLAFVLTLLGLAAAPSAAAGWGGLSGHVVSVRGNRPVANVEVVLYRVTGVTNGHYRVMRVRTNARGFFSKMPLQPGRYVVLSRIPGVVDGCAVDDVIGSETTRVAVRVGYKTLTCSGPRIDPAMINPNAGGDLYIR